MVCEGFALRDLLMEIAPPKQEEEKVPSWDAVRKEDTWKIGPSSGNSKNDKDTDLDTECLPRGDNVEFTGCLQQQKNAEVVEGVHADSKMSAEVDEAELQTAFGFRYVSDNEMSCCHYRISI